MEPAERMARALEALGNPAPLEHTRCETSKRMYRTQAEARQVARHHEARISIKKRGIRFEVYHCKKCGWWHSATKETT